MKKNNLPEEWGIGSYYCWWPCKKHVQCQEQEKITIGKIKQQEKITIGNKKKE